MKVDFNNARMNALRAHADLVSTLRSHCEDGQIGIDALELADCMDDLRGALATIAATCSPGDDEFRCVLPESPLPSLVDE